jgi:YVTN family beta-propeller protein
MKLRNLSTMLCLPLFLFANTLVAAPTPSGAILVLEKEQNTLVIVDPASLTIVARVPVGDNPHEVAVADDGKIAYISNYGGNTISRVDLVAQKPLPPIDLGALRLPHGLEFVGGKLFFTAEGAKVVGHYDPATGKIDWVVGTGQDRTHMVIATKDLKTVLTSNVSSGTISLITQAAPGQGRGPGGPGGPGGPPPGRGPGGGSGRGGPPGGGPGGGGPDWEVTNIPVGHGSEGFDLTPDGKELWVANAQDKTISVIDLAAKKVVATLPSTGNANRLKITLDGKYAFVSDLGGTDMLIIDVATRKPFKTMKMGASSEGLLMAPDGMHVYTTLNDHDSVAVIDLKTFTVTGEVKTGRGPDGLAWASRK